VRCLPIGGDSAKRPFELLAFQQDRRRIMARVNPIPEGHHTVTPYLTLKNTAAALDFYKKAFGAEELYRMPGPDGQSIMHAEMKIGDSMVMLGEECPDMGVVSPLALNNSPVTVHLYVENADAVFQRAVSAGAETMMPPTDMFWGDRFAKVKDPFGHRWSIATPIEDVPPDQMMERMKKAFAQK
jgi:PhnB protein